MDHRSVENLYAVVTPGLEEVCAVELAELGMTQIEPDSGGVAFRGRLEEIYLTNLRLRTASRILVRFASFRCRSFPDLYRQAVRLPWGRFFKSDTPPRFKVTCRHSRLMHSERVAETLQDAVGRSFGATKSLSVETAQLVLVRVINDQIAISIDSSGELLHRRGYRRATTRAPLRETLAAGILLRLGWNGSMPLVDPMCGTGTFVLEAAILAADRAPGKNRRFAFQSWPGYRNSLWQRLTCEAAGRELSVKQLLAGFDRDEMAVAAARDNLIRLDIEGPVSFDQKELSRQRPREGPGLLICNPPYGKRLQVAESLTGFYRELGRRIKQKYPDWRVALLCPDPKLVQVTGLPLRRIAELRNGGLDVGLYGSVGAKTESLK